MIIEIIATKGKEKYHKGPASCTERIEFLNNIRGFLYIFGIYIYIYKVIFIIILLLFAMNTIYISQPINLFMGLNSISFKV